MSDPREALLEAIAAELDAMMTASSITQQRLAALSDVDRVTINQILKMARAPRIGTVYRLADAMGYRLEVKFTKL